jgi:hypothetical protein
MDDMGRACSAIGEKMMKMIRKSEVKRPLSRP